MILENWLKTWWDITFCGPKEGIHRSSKFFTQKSILIQNAFIIVIKKQDRRYSLFSDPKKARNGK